MTERKQFTPYGYNPYQHQAEQAGPSIEAQQQRAQFQRRNRGMMEKVFGAEMADKMRTPMFATVSLLAVGVAFAAVIAISYPSGSNDGGNVPLVTASVDNFKVQPGEEGSISVAHQDSTVFNVMSSASNGANPFDTDLPVENLLEPAEPMEEAVDTLQAFAAEAQEEAAQMIEPASGAAQETKESVESLLLMPEAKEAPAEEILKKIEPEQVASTIPQSRQKIAAKDIVAEAAQQPERLHAAGSSPDTIAFVRSVLDQKDSGKTAASSAKVAAAQAANIAAVEPAAGVNAIMAPSNISAGSYYVQLGSVTSRTGADAEWGKMSKSLPISGLEYRVQEANLGERGTFYRIQAGPMSKDSASSLCDNIKAQKPGGCLVVK